MHYLARGARWDTWASGNARVLEGGQRGLREIAAAAGIQPSKLWVPLSTVDFDYRWGQLGRLLTERTYRQSRKEFMAQIIPTDKFSIDFEVSPVTAFQAERAHKIG